MRDYKVQMEELRRQNELLAAARTQASTSARASSSMHPPPLLHLSGLEMAHQSQQLLSPISLISPPTQSTTSMALPTSHSVVLGVDSNTLVEVRSTSGTGQDQINGLLSSLLINSGSRLPSTQTQPSAQFNRQFTDNLLPPYMNRSKSVSEIGPPLYSLAPTTVNPVGSDAGGGGASCGAGKMLQANLLLNSLLLREKQEAALRSVGTVSTALTSALSASKSPPTVTAVSS